MEVLMDTSEFTVPWKLWMTVWEIQARMCEILHLDDDTEWKKLVVKNMQWENMGTISYQFDNQDSSYSNYKICNINFFGTQNGRKESYYEKRLRFLWEYWSDSKHIAYNMMRKFIQDICIPRWIQKIYLDADWSDKKEFWKEKMWTYLIQHHLIQKQYSQCNEVCYVL
jgi:hypothetical protein